MLIGLSASAQWKNRNPYSLQSQDGNTDSVRLGWSASGSYSYLPTTKMLRDAIFGNTLTYSNGLIKSGLNVTLSGTTTTPLKVVNTGSAYFEVDGGNSSGNGGYFAFKQLGSYKGVFGAKSSVVGSGTSQDFMIQSYSDNLIFNAVSQDKKIINQINGQNINSISNNSVYNSTSLNSTGIAIKAFGDSYTASGKYPPDVIVGPTEPDSSWVRIFAEKTQMPLEIYAVNGSFLADQMSVVYGQSPLPGVVNTYYIGTNDDRYYTTDNQIEMWGKAHKEQLAYLSISRNNRIDANQMTQSGTWSSGTPYAGGLSSISNGSTLTFKTKGTSVLLSYLIQNGNTGSFTVTIDGVSKGTLNKPYSDNVGNYLWAIDFIPQLAVFDGLSNQEHEVVLTVTGATSYIYWASSGNKFNEPNLVKTITSTVNTLGPSAGSSDTVIFKFNDAIRSNVNSLNIIGLDVSLADNGLAIDKTSTYLIPDDTHPNNFANKIIANNFLYAFNGNQNLATKNFASNLDYGLKNTANWKGENLSTSSKVVGDIISYNGTNWVNKAITATSPLSWDNTTSGLSIDLSDIVTTNTTQSITGSKTFTGLDGNISGTLSMTGGLIRNLDTDYWNKIAYWGGSGYLGYSTIPTILGYTPADVNDTSKAIDTTSGAPTPTSTGVKNQRIYNGGYMYECIATNTWIRHAVETTW